MARTVRIEDITSRLLEEIRTQVRNYGTAPINAKHGDELISSTEDIDLDSIIRAALIVFKDVMYK